MMALTMALVGDAVPKERTGSAMGLLGSTSAVGTALGPSLGGVLIASLGWQAIFLVSVPLGVIALVLAQRQLPADRRTSTNVRAGFDLAGTLLLALTLAAYALAMTMGRGRFGLVNIVLLAAAALGVGLFVLVEARAASPLIRLARFRDPVLSASLAMSALVSTVMMATLVVGPFYLARAAGPRDGARRHRHVGGPGGRRLDRGARGTVRRTALARHEQLSAGSSGWWSGAPPCP